MKAGAGEGPSLYLIIHGHFYQPPRENPWLRAIERQEGAAPHHDWNRKILAECYRPNTRSRVLDGEGRIREIVNNLEQISFNFGPTLLRYVEEEDRETYERILEADRKSAAARGGHGNAIAQAYHHVILPLATPADRDLLIRWGLDDFKRRFGRASEGLWLPETAIDAGTALSIAEAGVRFVILSPYQAKETRPLDGGEWTDASGGSIDPRKPYRLFPDEARDDLFVDVLFCDAGLSAGISFEHYLRCAGDLGKKLRAAAGKEEYTPRLVHVATDGEVYGHHEPFADMCLAALFGGIARSLGFRTTNPGEFLDRVPPADAVRLEPGPDGEGTAWSCSHGVGRWARDCGCSVAHAPGWNQKWRAPLREALERLRETLDPLFEEEASVLFHDPREALRRYVDLLGNETPARWRAFLERHGREGLARRAESVERAASLLEMAHALRRMFTSCGWFFDDIAGIEASQNLLFAAHAIDVAGRVDGERAARGEERLRTKLREAVSNVPGEGDGRSIYDDRADRAAASLGDWAAALAAARLLDVAVPRALLAGREVSYCEEERFDREGFRSLGGRLDVKTPTGGDVPVRFLAAIGPEQRLRVWVGGAALDTSPARRAVDLDGLAERMEGEGRRLADLPGEFRRLVVDRLVDGEREIFYETEERFFAWIRSLATLIDRAGLAGPSWFRRALALYLERGVGCTARSIVAAGGGEETVPLLERLAAFGRLAGRFGIDVEAREARGALSRLAFDLLRRRREGEGERWAAETAGLLDGFERAGFPISDLGRLQDEFFDQWRDRIVAGPEARKLGARLGFSPGLFG